VPRMVPSWVSGLCSVVPLNAVPLIGEFAAMTLLARPKSSSFAPVFGDHDISRLQVAMYDPLPVCLVESLGDLCSI